MVYIYVLWFFKNWKVRLLLDSDGILRCGGSFLYVDFFYLVEYFILLDVNYGFRNNVDY